MNLRAILRPSLGARKAAAVAVSEPGARRDTEEVRGFGPAKALGTCLTAFLIGLVGLLGFAPEAESATDCAGKQVVPSQNLVNVANNAPSGTTFCLQQGTYEISAPVKVQSDDRFVGVYSKGRPRVTTDTAPSVFDANGSDGARIVGLTASGAVGDTSCQPSCGRGISGGTNLTIVDVRAEDNANQGVGGTGPNLVIRDSVFDSNGSKPFYAEGTYASAAGVKSVNSMFIYNSRATNNAWVGFWCDLECGTFEVHDSVASGNGKGGIFYEVSTGPAVFEGNVIKNNGYSEVERRPGGLLMVSSQNAQSYGNTFGGNNEAGVRITEDQRSPTVSNIQVRDNRLEGDPLMGCTITSVSCTDDSDGRDD